MLAMPESHLEIVGSAGFSSLPIKRGFLPEHITLRSALVLNFHVGVKAADLTPKSKPVWIWVHREQLESLWQTPPGDRCEPTAPYTRQEERWLEMHGEGSPSSLTCIRL